MIKKNCLLLPIYIVFNILFILVCGYFYEINELSYYNFSKYYNYLLILNIIVLFIIFIKRTIKKEKMNFNIVDVAVILILFFGIISVIFAIKPNVALHGIQGRYEGYLMILYYFSIFLLSTFVEKEYKKIIVFSLLIVGVIQLAYAILQINEIEGIVRHYNYSEVWATGFTTNPGFFSTFMLLCLCYAMGLYIDENKLLVNIVYMILISLFTVGLLISNAMSGVVGLISVMMFILFYVVKVKRIKKMVVILLIIFSSLLVVCKLNITKLVGDFRQTAVETKEIAKGNINDNFGTKRLFIWKNTLKIVPQNILNGVGIDNFYYAFGNRPLWKGNYFYDKAHNEYLQILICEGVFALIVYLCFYGIILIRGIRNCFKNKEVYLIVPVIGYLVQAFFNFSVIEVEPYVFIAIGLCVLRGNYNEKSKCRNTNT